MKSPLANTRALLFVALSAVAVPACQQFEGGGKSDRDHAALLRLTPPPAAETAADSRRASGHRT